MESFEGWAILELMGHRRLAGFVRDVEMFGGRMCRIDVPGPVGGEPKATQFYAAGAIYCVTPTTEETARRVAETGDVAPVKPWEFPSQLPAASQEGPGDDDRW